MVFRLYLSFLFMTSYVSQNIGETLTAEDFLHRLKYKKAFKINIVLALTMKVVMRIHQRVILLLTMDREC